MCDCTRSELLGDSYGVAGCDPRCSDVAHHEDVRYKWLVGEVVCEACGALLDTTNELGREDTERPEA